jgi:ligand-binding sensor domain-containing protein/signal transduction histidine kinase
MKVNRLLILSGMSILLSCNSKQESNPLLKDVDSTILEGIINKDRSAPPEIIEITAANAPKVIPAGRPVTVQNPNANGLGDPEFILYGEKDGLPLNNTTSALKDKMGNIWFCSNGGGVSKYDGKKFTVFSAVNGMDNGIYQLAEDTAGNIWFHVGDAEVYKYDGIKFSNDTMSIKLKDFGIRCMTGDSKGNIWFGTGKGICKYRSDAKPVKREIITTAQGLLDNTVNCIKEDRAGNLWFGTDSGVSKYDGSGFTNFTVKQGLAHNPTFAIEEDRAGNIWIAADSGVSRYNGQQFFRYSKEQGLVSNRIRVIKADHEGSVWFGSRAGLSRFDTAGNIGQGLFSNYTKAQGLPENIIKNITEDNEGGIWIGTESGGICRYNSNRITKYTTAHGLAGNSVRSVIQDKEGFLWFATESGVSKYDGTTFFNYSKIQGLPNNDVYSMRSDRKGNIWFGCFGALSKFDGKTFTNYSPAQGVPDGEVFNILEDRAGDLWLTSWEGVRKFDGQRFILYGKDQGLVSDEILSVVEDRKKNMWFSAAGLSRFVGKQFFNYTMKNGLPIEEVPGLMEDKQGNIWLGTYGKGVGKLTGNRLTLYTTTDGLADNAIFSIREDTVHHRIWFGTNSGLSMLKTDARSTQNKDTVSFENFNYRTGFDIKNSSFNFSLFIDTHGVIWGGTGDNKLFRFDYDHLKKNTTPFNLQLQNISINNEKICWSALRRNSPGKEEDSLTIINEMISTFGKRLTVNEVKTLSDKYGKIDFDRISRFNLLPENPVLPYGENNVSFEFGAILPSTGNQVKYQYLLEGYDKTWSPLTIKTNAGFGNINEGEYVFRLKAVNASGVWNETSYRFTVLPPWYRTWWAWSIYLLLFLAALRMFSKWRERNLRKEKVLLESKVTERTTELKSALEHLTSTQAQLIHAEKMASLGELTAGIAHEIQNPLNFVNNFSDVSVELLNELKEGPVAHLDDANKKEAEEILGDLSQNLEKINHHGKRADSIVKGMLQHSRTSTGQKEPTDINALADEYLRLSYQGFRAKNNSFNATLQTNFDPKAGKVNIVPQDIGRVLLNLYNNAFYAVAEKSKNSGPGYKPTISVVTRQIPPPGLPDFSKAGLPDSKEAGGQRGAGASISIRDNGSGIPQKILDKIFQPFFTTKPTGQGTGLGLSLSYDIVKAHGGEINVETEEGKYTEFIIQLKNHD